MPNSDLDFILRCSIYLISNYSYVLGEYVSDVYAKNHFFQFPSNWQLYFNNLSLNDIYHIFGLNCFTSTKIIAPLSFLSFASLCNSVNRNLRKKSLKYSTTKDNLIGKESTVKLINNLQRHLTPKKIHEVERLSQVINSICKSAGENKYRVVDIGGGQGHLVRYLSILHDIPVISIDNVKHNSEKAEKIDEKIIAMKSKHRAQSESIETPIHRTLYLHKNMNDADWHSVMGGGAPVCEFDRYLINGLHSCGELAPTMIEMFCRLSSCSVLILTSCCYHKCRIDTSTSLPLMSARCRDILHLPLTYEILESACHFKDDYFHKLNLATVSYDHMKSLESQLFRAAFQEIICNRDLSERFGRSRLKAVKYDCDRNCSLKQKFHSYARQLLTRAHITPSELSESESSLALKRIEDDWRQVIVFYCCRLMLGPVVEALLLIDRVMFLREHDIKANIYEIFDASISPRNSAIVAWK